MSSVLSCASPVKSLPWLWGCGRETEWFVPYFWKKENNGRKLWKIVNLRVPGKEKSNTVPSVIRICQDTQEKQTCPSTLNQLAFVTVPEMSKFRAAENLENVQDGSEESGSDCIPSIKRCTLEEIEAFKGRYVSERERTAKKKRKRKAAETNHLQGGGKTHPKPGKAADSADLTENPNKDCRRRSTIPRQVSSIQV